MSTLEKRDLFFEFLEENGLNPQTYSSILEIAPNVSTSVSASLVEKYGELYKQFLLSPRFEYANEYGVKGEKGGALLYRGKTLIETKRPEKLCLRNEPVVHPKEEDFDTLLIRGQLDEAYSLAYSNLSLLFGDVVDLEDSKTLDDYQELLRLINKHTGGYDWVAKLYPEYDKVAYLIKRK